MAILIRCIDIITAPRTIKSFLNLQEKGIEHRHIEWDRDGVFVIRNTTERPETLSAITVKLVTPTTFTGLGRFAQVLKAFLAGIDVERCQ